MKRLFATLLAALLVFTALPLSASAAGTISAFDDTVSPVVTSITGSTALSATNTGFTVNVNPTLIAGTGFSVGEALTGVAPVIIAGDATYNNQTDFNSLFTTQALTVGAVDGGGQPTAITLQLATTNSFASSATYKFKLGFQYSGVTTSNVYELNVTLTATPPNGTISTFKTGPFTMASGDLSGYSNASWNSGSVTATTQNQFSFKIDLKKTAYFNTQGSTAPSAAQVAAAVSGASASSSFNATVNASGELVVTSPASPSVMSGNVSVTVTGASGVGNANFLIPVTVTQYTPPTPTIDQVLSSSLTWTMPSGDLTVGDTFNVVITKNNFTWLNGSRDLESGDINTIKNWFSITPSNNFETISNSDWSVNANGEIVVTIKAKRSGTVNVEAALTNGGTANVTKNNVKINEPAPPTITGVNTNSSISASIPSSMKVGDSFTVTFTPNNLTWSDGSSSGKSITVAQAQQYFEFSPAGSFTSNWTQSGSNVLLTLTAKTAGNVSFRAGAKGNGNPAKTGNITITAVSVTGNKINGIASGAYLGDKITLDGSGVSTNDIEDLTVQPGAVLYLDFDSNFFTWENGNPSPAVNVTSSMLSSGKITVRHGRKSGTDVIDSVELVNESGRARVKVTFKESVSNLKEVKFSHYIYFQVNGRRHTDSQATLAGVLENDTQYAYDGETYYDMTDAPILEAEDTIRNAELYVGNYMTIHTTLTKNRKYYASSNTDYTDSDLKIFDRNSYIAEILYLETQNIPTGATVSFDTDAKYYVYNKDGKLLGTTADKVALSGTYYLSTRRVDLNTGSGTSVIEDPNSSSTGGWSSTTPSSSTGGTGGAGNTTGGTGNNNYNPPTGAVPSSTLPGLGVAVLLLAGCLAVAGRKER